MDRSFVQAIAGRFQMQLPWEDLSSGWVFSGFERTSCRDARVALRGSSDRSSFIQSVSTSM